MVGVFLIGAAGGGPDIPAWVFMAILGVFDLYYSYFILSLVRDKPIVKTDFKALNTRLGLILLYAAVIHAIGFGLTLIEGDAGLWVWVVMLAALGAWLVYAWKQHRETLLKYNVNW